MERGRVTATIGDALFMDEIQDGMVNGEGGEMGKLTHQQRLMSQKQGDTVATVHAGARDRVLQGRKVS